MSKKSGDGGDKPKKPRGPRKPRGPQLPKAETSNVINLSEVDREAFQQRIKEAAARIPDPQPSSPDAADSGAPAHARGRPVYAPGPEERAQVAGLRAAGATKDVIARHMGISRPTLDKHYAIELEHGFAAIGAVAVNNVTQLMLRGDFKATRFWLETHMGWGKRMHRNPLPTSVVHEADFEQLPAGPQTVLPGQGDPAAPALPLNEDGDYEVAMTLGLDTKDIKE